MNSQFPQSGLPPLDGKGVMSSQAKLRWSFAAKNARSAAREGLSVGCEEPRNMQKSQGLTHPHP